MEAVFDFGDEECYLWAATGESYANFHVWFFCSKRPEAPQVLPLLLRLVPIQPSGRRFRASFFWSACNVASPQENPAGRPRNELPQIVGSVD